LFGGFEYYVGSGVVVVVLCDLVVVWCVCFGLGDDVEVVIYCELEIDMGEWFEM